MTSHSMDGESMVSRAGLEPATPYWALQLTENREPDTTYKTTASAKSSDA